MACRRLPSLAKGHALDGMPPDSVCLKTNGLGLPDRRWAPGTSWGPFRFLGQVRSREDLQAIAHHGPVCAREELVGQHLPRTVRLVWTQHMQTDRSGHEVGKLQTF